MARGGARKGAGRKNSWGSNCPSSETVTIRVPKHLKEQILTIAHKLNSGELNDLDPVMAKPLIFDTNLVRPRDRAPVKRVMAKLFNVDKRVFDNDNRKRT